MIENARLAREKLTQGETLLDMGVEAPWYAANCRVFLDSFHGMQRLQKVLLKSHGAFSVFMSRLRDAIFIVSQDDKKKLFLNLRDKGFSENDLELLEKHNYSYIASKCRRMIPEPVELEARI